MMQKTLVEEIKTKILNAFDSVYCDTCAHELDGSACDECHRKAMNWSISEEFAGQLADDIVDIFVKPIAEAARQPWPPRGKIDAGMRSKRGGAQATKLAQAPPGNKVSSPKRGG